MNEEKSKKSYSGILVGCLIVGIVGIFIVIALITSIKNETTNNRSNKSETKTEQIGNPLVVREWKATVGQYGNRVIVGVVRNCSDKQFSYAQIEFNLYDQEGNQVGSALANINNLEPYGTWKFEAGIMEDNATKIKLKDVSGW